MACSESFPNEMGEALRMREIKHIEIRMLQERYGGDEGIRTLETVSRLHP